MNPIMPATDFIIVMCILGVFLALIAGLAWGQFQTWRADRENENRSGKRSAQATDGSELKTVR